MHRPELLTLPTFENLIYICDSSSLINIERNGNLRNLRGFAKHTNGRVRVPLPVGKEISRRGDDLRSWWLRNRSIVETRFIMGREHRLHEEVAIKYGKDPFSKEGKTFSHLSDADTYAVVSAIVKKWTLVTDDQGMQAVCRQPEHNTKYVDTKEFEKVIGAFHLDDDLH